MELRPLNVKQKIILFLVSLGIVAFGQPAWHWAIGLIAAAIGYALFWRILLDIPSAKKRFIWSAIWFAGVQYVQLSWAITHPYFYIYFIYTFFAVTLGLQFGCLGLLMTPDRLTKLSQVFAIASLWTIFEWARLFFLSGFSWNPIGLALTGSLYPLQMASLLGVFGLSFWVMFANLLALRAWLKGFSASSLGLFSAIALFPYLYGMAHVQLHQDRIEQTPKSSFVLVQTAFPAERYVSLTDRKQIIAQVINEWKEILKTLQKQKEKKIDLIVLPEYAVQCGTYTCVFPPSIVKKAFEKILGPDSIAFLPPLESPFAKEWKTDKGNFFLVNNAYWTQALANYFNSGVIIGLEDVEEVSAKEREHYSAALYFRPQSAGLPETWPINRYEKRVLVPFGEYIPFSFCDAIAAYYGITGSFSSGKGAKVFKAADNLPFGISICYEETFGNLMRENKHNGAELLVNLTSDAWYPDSRLPQQHFSHAILRTVENGFPLIRSCNIGVTGAVDSIGRTLSTLGDGLPKSEWLIDSMHVEVPRYHYRTLYSYWGDGLIIGFCLLASCFAFLNTDKKK